MQVAKAITTNRTDLADLNWFKGRYAPLIFVDLLIEFAGGEHDCIV